MLIVSYMWYIDCSVVEKKLVCRSNITNYANISIHIFFANIPLNNYHNYHYILHPYHALITHITPDITGSTYICQVLFFACETDFLIRCTFLELRF